MLFRYTFNLCGRIWKIFVICLTKSGHFRRLFQIIVKAFIVISGENLIKALKMFKTIVNELVGCETIDLKIRSNEGDEFILQVKPEEKFTKLKEEIWKNIGVDEIKTQLSDK